MSLSPGQVLRSDHLNNILRALREATSCLSGLAVEPTSPPSMNVIVRAGTAVVNGSIVTLVSDVTVPVPTPDPSYPRFDLVTLKADGTVGYYTGTPDAPVAVDLAKPETYVKPSPPRTPAGELALAEVFVPAGASAVDRIIDRRVVTGLSASQVTRGVFDVARIPDLDASKIVSGRFSMARMPDGPSGYVLTAKGVGVDPSYDPVAASNPLTTLVKRVFGDPEVCPLVLLENCDEPYLGIIVRGGNTGSGEAVANDADMGYLYYGELYTGATQYNDRYWYACPDIAEHPYGISYLCLRSIGNPTMHAVWRIRSMHTTYIRIALYIGGWSLTSYGAYTAWPFIIFRVESGSSPGNWICVTRTRGGAETTTNSGITLDTAVHKFEIRARRDEVRFFIDDVLVATHTTNLPDPGYDTLRHIGVVFVTDEAVDKRIRVGTMALGWKI